jgi:hypothetical protein
VGSGTLASPERAFERIVAQAPNMAFCTECAPLISILWIVLLESPETQDRRWKPPALRAKIASLCFSRKTADTTI